ncbi:hypothetical protein ACH4N4_19475 [Streptomyces microflavus]|uniref:hypothetical protein n=1 Tax=Streptomyces microflavus TaxID=1919 RepID=UPI0037A1E15C
MSRQLTTQNATITTASIQVQALTIGKKQVTLAVFRQLEDANIINTLDAGLAGEPWGRVNYHPDKCADDKEHLHVVWEKDGELRRATVYEPSVASHRHLKAGLYVEALIAEGLTYAHRGNQAGRPDRLQVVRSRTEDGPGFAQFIHRGVQFRGSVRNEFTFAFNDSRPDRSREELWHRLRHVAGPDATSGSLAEQLPALGYTTSWRRLKESPQLFIAV